MYNENAINDEDRNNLPIGSGVEDENGERMETEVQEVGSAGKKTMETLKAGETILEAIEIYEDEKGKMEEYEQVRMIKNYYCFSTSKIKIHLIKNLNLLLYINYS